MSSYVGVDLSTHNVGAASVAEGNQTQEEAA